ncbi:metallophosphoesterase [Paenibacillus beijingensis]|uniref:Calcineurin-like phosphoesterase domain-containing protein n=1 Tax=Paenibacillus beijingensis TaxID=1126833 RepID=A0A0D5NJB7_9BACL|nr:metallophosphoesterase [Paenibacillus beijingensis]AJY75092.1 hypothetical protein VN24_11525 [Paenibacillus beijingensis]
MSRIFVISDIHGHIEGARLLLNQASYQPGTDLLILLGDFMNNDPSAWNVLRFIRALTKEGAVAIAGNMERSLLESAKLKGVKSSDHRADIEFVRQLPLFFIKEPYLFVHAGLRPGVSLEHQSATDLTTIREEFWNSDNPAIPYTVVFGHTPTVRLGAHPGELWHGPGRLGIDTGAKHGLRLTLVELTGRLAYSCSTHPSTQYQDIRQTSWPAEAMIQRRN